MLHGDLECARHFNKPGQFLAAPALHFQLVNYCDFKDLEYGYSVLTNLFEISH